jgi:hypothetical protein
MKKKTFEELREQRSTANEKLGDLYLKANNREFTAEEQMEVTNLTREIEECERQMRGINLDQEHSKAVAERERMAKNEQFRALMRESREGKSLRTILLNPGTNVDGSSNTIGNIAASGAIQLTIHDVIPTLHEGLDLPKGLAIVTGVEGNEVWPVSVNDVECEEKGEVQACSEQTLDFANITPTPRRVTLSVAISNQAIDNAAFDLMAFVQRKITIAMRKYLAKKIYSQAAWDGNKGPFGGMTPKEIVLGADAYKNILAAVAEFSNEGFFEGDVCISMDRVTEAQLKATPKVAGAAAGFVIEDGLCCGYPYTVSHYVNTKLNGGGTALEPTEDRYLEIGYWEWFALQEHNNSRLVVDGFSADVAKNNVTKVVFNSLWSMTDLSIYINGGKPTQGANPTYPSTAFGLYKIVDGEEPETT